MLGIPGGRGGRLSLEYRREESDDGTSRPFLNPSWLLTPAVSQNVYRHASPQPPKPTQAPFLTVALLKLEEILVDFCETIAHPSHHNATKACSLLDSSVATAGSPAESRCSSPRPSNYSPGTSPKSPRLSWLSSKPGSNRHSPPKSPLLNWLSNPSQKPTPNSPQHSPTVAASALALEGEWETYASPFLLLAGAEVLFADLLHCREPANGPALKALYQRTVSDMLLVKQMLCDPLLGTIQTTKYTKAASSLATCIAGLTAICTCRCQWLELQASLFAAQTNLGEVSMAVTVILNSIMALGDVGAAEAMKNTLIIELKTWKYCLEACSALQQCQFLETIVGLRKWDRSLVDQHDLLKNQDTRMARWLYNSHQEVLSLLPIYFDRVDAFAGPLYGFDTTQLFQGKKTKNDWESVLLEFLRRQEKSGGPPTAVAIVLDAVGSSNRHIERGFRWNTEEDKDEELTPQVMLPAAYLRSTTHLNSSTQRSSAGSRGGSGLLRQSQSSSSSLLPSWSTDVNSSPQQARASRKNVQPHAKWNVMEYAPDTGEAKSWPHSEWEGLVSLLYTNEAVATPAQSRLDASQSSHGHLAEEPVAVTYAEREDSKRSKDSLLSAQEAATLFSTDPPSGSPNDNSRRKPQSTFHVVSLSDFLSMVVIVKGEEESRWHRRRTKLPDEEVRSFLNEMASKLRISSIFTADNVPAGDKGEPSLQLPTDQTDWDDDQVQEFLKQLKDSFGLRPMAKTRDNVRSFSIMGKKSPIKSARRRRRSTNLTKTPLSESAAALFLGPDLFQHFSPG